MSNDHLTEVTTNLAFDVAVDRISTALTRAGLAIFARIDHAAGARDVGLSMPPTIVLVYGNAKGGTPIMQAVPAAALDLPLRVLIRENTAGHAVVAFHPAREMLVSAGVPDALASRLEPAQHLVLEAVRPA